MQGSGGFWSQWWQMGGLLGLSFVVLFVIGAFVLQGSPPAYDDPVGEIRDYFSDNGSAYLAGDFLIGAAFFLCFLPFAAALRALLRLGEPEPHLYSLLCFVGALATVLLATAAAAASSALAFSLNHDLEVDDALVRGLMYLNLTLFNGLGYSLALMGFTASILMLRSAVVWRWLGYLGLSAALLNILGAAWLIDGNDSGLLAFLGFLGFLFFAAWLLFTSLAMVWRQELPREPRRDDRRGWS